MSDQKVDQLGLFLRRITEAALTKRARRRYIQSEKSRRRSRPADWALSFLWAVVWVFFINQYLVQAYEIPSGSMIPALQIRDRLFVDKLSMGPELLPGVFKLPGLRRPQRADVIVFQNPQYRSKGTFFEIAHRLIYMITLSFVDINRDERGNPSVQLLIKRAAGYSGDHIVFRDGELYIKAAGEESFMSENEFKALSGLAYTQQRLVSNQEENENRKMAVYDVYRTFNLPPPPAAADGGAVLADAESRYPESAYRLNASEYWRSIALCEIYPLREDYQAAYARQKIGYYVPDGYILPLGDNRDDSKDGRSFGAVPQKNVLGKALFRFAPLNRIGGVR